MDKLTFMQFANMMYYDKGEFVSSVQAELDKTTTVKMKLTKVKKDAYLFVHSRSAWNPHKPFFGKIDVNSNCYNRFGENSYTSISFLDNSVNMELKKNKYITEEAEEINGHKVKLLAANNNVIDVNEDGIFRINMINGEKALLTSEKDLRYKNGKYYNSVNMRIRWLFTIRGIDIYDYDTSSGEFQQGNESYYFDSCEQPLYDEEYVELQSKYRLLISELANGGMINKSMHVFLAGKETKDMLKSLGFNLKNDSIIVILGDKGHTYHFDENENLISYEKVKGHEV